MTEILVPGKWILAGEHAVLRGAPALVFPLKSRALRLSFESSSKPSDLSVVFSGEYGSEIQLLFWGVLERACELAKISRQDLKGHLQIESSLPIGAGLGTSAALCVAVTRWLESQNLLRADSYEFARSIENLFHGESSGVDIAVALSGHALHFERSGLRKEFYPQWQPKLYLSYCGQRGVTRECVQAVKAFIEKNPARGSKVDEKMKDSVLLAEEALLLSMEEGLPLLAQAVNDAGDCFKEWGLFTDALADRAKELRSAGAIAVKPTGSGNGGYLLSLWKDSPGSSLGNQFIPCF